jgi:hypothetical protein
MSSVANRRSASAMARPSSHAVASEMSKIPLGSS